MSAQKTQPSSQSAEAFIRGIADPERRKECRTLARIMKKATGALRPARRRRVSQ